MIVQWCCKGVAGIDHQVAREILTSSAGLRSKLWLNDPDDTIDYDEAFDRLTEEFLDAHVNDFEGEDPIGSGKKVCDVTPFISLSAGCVERDVFRQTNVLNPARRTALEFATKRGTSKGWLFTCYVVVAINRSARIASVAEEIRDLNQGRRYSQWFVEGEVAAKICVPSRQILGAELWGPEQNGEGLERFGGYLNNEFVGPRSLLNLRKML